MKVYISACFPLDFRQHIVHISKVYRVFLRIHEIVHSVNSVWAAPEDPSTKHHSNTFWDREKPREITRTAQIKLNLSVWSLARVNIVRLLVTPLLSPNSFVYFNTDWNCSSSLGRRGALIEWSLDRSDTPLHFVLRISTSLSVKGWSENMSLLKLGFLSWAGKLTQTRYFHCTRNVPVDRSSRWSGVKMP